MTERVRSVFLHSLSPESFESRALRAGLLTCTLLFAYLLISQNAPTMVKMGQTLYECLQLRGQCWILTNFPFKIRAAYLWRLGLPAIHQQNNTIYLKITNVQANTLADDGLEIEPQPQA